MQTFSYVPEGLISHIAPSPGELCSKCSTLDYPSYFATNLPRTPDLVFDNGHFLGTYYEITRKASSCDFCRLVIEALKYTTASLNREALLSLSTRQSVNVFLANAWSGSYYLRRDKAADSTSLESPERVDVGCMMVYTDVTLPNAASRTQQDRGFIRLLANDAHLLGQEPMYHGRIIGNHVSPDLLRKWIKAHDLYHKTCIDISDSWGLEHLAGPRSLRYIDTENMCLYSTHLYNYVEHGHVSLSYVWGGSQGLQLVKSNEALLFTKGSLSEAWSNIPAVIQDAIELVRDLNVDDSEKRLFLWVDQLCIVQDDPKDKAIQIQQMDQTYSRSIVTLIAAEGSHSDVPLTRRKCQSVSLDSKRGGLPSSSQTIRNIQGIRLLAALPGPSDAINRSVWDTRAWTLQESELSHSAIIFGKDQVTFRCAQEVFCEDFVAETRGEVLPEIWAIDQTWLSSLAAECKIVPIQDRDWPQTFDMYGRIVESYTNRTMTYPTDILSAFQGVSHVLHALCAWKMSNGLVEDVIDFALLWRPNGNIKRRFRLNGDPGQQQQDQGTSELYLPTYSWSAWLGPITYRPHSYNIKSLIQRFEVIGATNKKRRMLRFCQNIDDDSFGVFVLEPEPPYAPKDCSYMDEMAQGLYWFGPQAKNLAYRMHLTKKPHNQNKDGPSILQFITKCVRLVLSPGVARPDHQDEGEEACRRVWLLDDKYRKVGTAWFISALDDYNNGTVDAILLSKNKSESEQADGWQFDRQVGSWHEWCLCNVMLIKRLPGKGLCERLTIGKIHERCADDGLEETIRLV
ncbi:MAG: hypothetical protein LQ338_003808 [Usnochroma carphineum]|nr:MAG: hypothetical protein LQ338_003808 [Usnochroma carphineum]